MVLYMHIGGKFFCNISNCGYRNDTTQCFVDKAMAVQRYTYCRYNNVPRYPFMDTAMVQ